MSDATKKLVLVKEPCECPFRVESYECTQRQYKDKSGNMPCYFDSFPAECPLLGGMEYVIKFGSKYALGMVDQ
jgi:hypothetical protein